MPRGLRSHSNERIDLDDFRSASKEYTDARHAFADKALTLSRRSRFVEGFRIEISDQGANPGEVSVFNGHVFDRSGVLMTNEDQVNDSRTITLVGASIDFYLELEYIEDDADPDARAFWDSVYDNPSPDPDGREFTLTVPTRLAPNWRIVTPVSTTGFAVTADPDSTRIPLAILHTDAFNVITGPGALTQVTAATVLETDTTVGLGSIRVLNSRLFPDTGNMTVDFGGTAPEAVVISSNDRENGILTFAPNLASTHEAGAIVRVTGITARFLKENTDPNAVAVTGGTITDARRRLFQGDELRGSAIAQSKETFGARDDLNIESSKDYFDFMAAHLRDMRWGTLRPDGTSAAPPTAFSSPRYYDYAGGIAGARTASISIGDGTNSWGDMNGTGVSVFDTAIAALPSTGGTIFVKRGTYTFASTLFVTKPVRFVGEGRDISILNAVDLGISVSPGAGNNIEFCNITVGLDGAALSDRVLNVGNGILILRDCALNGRTVAGTASVKAYNCAFNNTSTIALPTSAFEVSAALTLSSSVFFGCTFNCDTGNAANAAFKIVGLTSQVEVSGCTITAPVAMNLGASTCATLKVHDCTITGTVQAVVSTGSLTSCSFTNNRLATTAAANTASTISLNNVTTTQFDGCYVESVVSGASTLASPHSLMELGGTVSASSIDSCIFNKNTAATFVRGIFLSTSDLALRLSISGCYFLRLSHGIHSTTLSANAELSISNCCVDGGFEADSVTGVYVDGSGADCGVTINGCTVRRLVGTTGATNGIYVKLTTATGRATVSNCTVDTLTSAGGINATGIFVSGDTVKIRAQVTGCKVLNIVGPNAAYGIQCTSSAPTSRYMVSNNQVDTITSSGGIAAGITVAYGQYCAISDNTLIALTGTTVYGVDAAGLFISTVTGNTCAGMIRIVEGSANTISDNMLYLASIASQYGIYVYSSSSVSGYTVHGNTINCPATALVAGIGFECSSTTVYIDNVLISENNVYGMINGGATSYGIRFSGQSNSLSITDNQVTESTLHLNNGGIYLLTAKVGIAFQDVNITGNTCTGDLVTATVGLRTTAAIFAMYASSLNIVANALRWDPVNSRSSQVSVANTCNNVSICSNTIYPSLSTIGNAIFVAATTLGVVVSGNCCTSGNTVNLGTHIDVNGVVYAAGAEGVSGAQATFGYNRVIP